MFNPMITDECGISTWAHGPTPAHAAWGDVTGWEIQVDGAPRTEYTPDTVVDVTTDGQWEVGFFALYEKLPAGQQIGRSKGYTTACPVVEEPEVDETTEESTVIPKLPVAPPAAETLAAPTPPAAIETAAHPSHLAETDADPFTAAILGTTMIVAAAAALIRKVWAR